MVVSIIILQAYPDEVAAVVITLLALIIGEFSLGYIYYKALDFVKREQEKVQYLEDQVRAKKLAFLNEFEHEEKANTIIKVYNGMRLNESEIKSLFERKQTMIRKNEHMREFDCEGGVEFLKYIRENQDLQKTIAKRIGASYTNKTHAVNRVIPIRPGDLEETKYPEAGDHSPASGARKRWFKSPMSKKTPKATGMAANSFSLAIHPVRGMNDQFDEES